MRTWRVGSFSMGAALVFLGIILLLSQVFKWKTAIVMLSWWPALFIILGIEILIYLKIRNGEQTPVKYDFISILFIGFIGTIGLAIAMLNMTGLFELTTQYISAEERTIDLPKYEELLTDEIKRVSVDTGSYDLAIESSAGNKVAMFGTYRAQLGKGQTPMDDVADYVLTEKQGDTLYIRLKEMPANRLIDFRGQVNTTLLIPADVKLDIVGNGRDMDIKPRDLRSDWSISNVGFLNVDMSENGNIKIKAKNVQELDPVAKWEGIKKEQSNEEENVTFEETMEVGSGRIVSIPTTSYEEEHGVLAGSLTFGSGKHVLIVNNSYSIKIQ